jgi:thiol-disulfide isomerase/thioredoxin
MADWRAVVSTNRSASAGDPLASWQGKVDRQRVEIETSAKQMLVQAAGLKVDFSQLRLTVAITTPKSLGSSRYPSVQAENESLSFADRLLLKITAVALTNAPHVVRCQGEYVIVLSQLMRFASNWRCAGGAQWSSFPDTVADQRMQRELAIMAKAAKHEPLTLVDDPELASLGEALKHFLQTQDEKVYEREAMFNLDSLIALDEKRAAMSGEAPKRANTESWWNSQKESWFASVLGVVDLMREAGIDLSKAEIKLKAAEFKSLYPRAGAGAIDGLEGNHLKMTFVVTTAAKAKNSKGLSGDYVLEADEAMRLGGRWRISRKVRWHALPEGVVDAKVKAELEYESYAAENGTLPPNTLAPDIEFVRFDNGQTNKLSDLLGQVVILDFWAINCGPCQEPLALMQKYREANPAWQDRVTVMTVSIDDTLKEARNHMTKRGWTNTFNTWAGEGDWQSAPAKAFRVTGIPTCYVINTNGVIVHAGHPMSMHAPEVVNNLLK